MLGRLGRLSRLGGVVVAGGVAAALSGCGSVATTASAGSVGGGSGSASPLPTYPPGAVASLPPAKSGGSSVQVEIPCDGGTSTLRVFPQGDGVAMTATLRHVAHQTWGVSADVSPVPDDTGMDPPLAQRHVQDGTLVVRADNLQGAEAVGGVRHAWPQTAEADLWSNPDNVDCGTNAYLDAKTAEVTTPNLEIHVQRSGQVEVHDSAQPKGGTWQVSVTVHSPSGLQRQTKSVVPKKQPRALGGYLFDSLFTGLTSLRNFTSVTVTASKAGQDTTWTARISRTP